MKIAIIYYSLTGNTKSVADILSDYLRPANQVDVLRINALDESKSFLGQCRRAFFKNKARIEDIKTDLSEYDTVIIGNPVWATEPVPALRTYLDRVSGVSGKKIVLFITYGGGLGKDSCIDKMEKLLKEKGASDFARFAVQQFKTKNREFVIEQAKKALGI